MAENLGVLSVYEIRITVRGTNSPRALTCYAVVLYSIVHPHAQSVRPGQWPGTGPPIYLQG